MERGWTALAIACKNGDHMSVESLLKARAIVDPESASAPSPMLRAIAANHNAQIVASLLLFKASPNRPHAQGVTPLFLVRFRCLCESIERDFVLML